MNNYIFNDSGLEKQHIGSQYPKELDGMSLRDKERVVQEVQKIRDIELAEERQFFERIDRVFEAFSHKGFSDDVSVRLTIAFLNDPIFAKKREKRKTITEIINQVKNGD